MPSVASPMMSITRADQTELPRAFLNRNRTRRLKEGRAWLVEAVFPSHLRKLVFHRGELIRHRNKAGIDLAILIG